MVVGNICTKDIGYDGIDSNIFESRVISRVRKRSEACEHGVVSFLLVTGIVIGFRESARLVEIAKDTGCDVRLAAGKLSGSSKSIFSIVHMGLAAGQSVLLTIEGKNREEAFHEIRKVLNGEADGK
ncbi:MAG TPA: hypothetical protein DEP57_06135 [Selenomonas sp.]|nr:HPr family phosphocarrier protein [Selenomonadaceae bacterium]HCB93373.1 hypothetical protein [Selenomonas sp.]